MYLQTFLSDLSSVRKAEVRIFSRMDRTNWSIKAFLYSHNQRSKTEAFSKFSIEHICVLLECSCWKGNFFQFPSHLNKTFNKKSKTCVKIFVIPFVFVYRRSSLISRSNTPFWRSNTALDGPLVNQSNRVVISSYTIMS